MAAGDEINIKGYAIKDTYIPYKSNGRAGDF